MISRTMEHRSHTQRYMPARQTLAFALALLSGVVTVPALAAAGAPNGYLLTDGKQSGLKGEQFVAPGIDTAKLHPDDKSVYSVKCWQNGTLILEETNKSAANIQPQTITFLPLGGGLPDMYLVDLHGTFCKVVRK